MGVEGLSGLALYAAVFAIVFVESGVPVGFWLPGDAMLLAVGLMAADPSNGVSVIVLAIGISIFAAGGSYVGHITGRRVGRPYLERRRAGLLGRMERFFDRWGAIALIAARFVPWARTFAPIVAGAVGMPRSRFLAAAGVGALIWGVGLTGLGYAAAHIPGLKESAEWIALGVVALAAVVGVLGDLVRRRRRRSAAAADGAAEAAPADGPATATEAATAIATGQADSARAGEALSS
ncbi:MAG: DedA family protein [Frankia sp.]|nr:DedA family protein [Frankia sp.]